MMAKEPIDFHVVRDNAVALPGVEESNRYRSSFAESVWPVIGVSSASQAGAKDVRCRQNTIVQPSFFACSSVYETPSTFNSSLSKIVIKPPLFPS